MCGRYKLTTPTSRVFDEFSLTGLRINLEPRYNIAPTQDAPVVRRSPTGRQISLVRWGMIPAWAPAQKTGEGLGAGQINARAETVARKPTFREALKSRRCLVVADGFYEWQQQERTKQPMLFTMRDEGVFAFAGLYETWNKAGTPLETFTIICTRPNALVATVHDRMPVILPKEHWDAWLDTAAHDAAAIVPLLGPFPADAMSVCPVNRDLGKVGRDDASLLVSQPPAQPLLL
jgi:putative SOS response-associated peptidase YedK